MKTLVLVLCLFSAACAHTTVRNNQGVVILRTQANADRLIFKAPGTSLEIINLDHAAATTAQGTAARKVLGGVATLATAAGAAVATSGVTSLVK